MITEQELIAAEHEETEAEESLEELEAKRDIDEEVEEEPLAEASYFDAIVALQQILDGEAVDVARVAGLSDVERQAIEFFGHVVSGRTEGNEFIFAEKRLEGLNHVLAVLQPILSVGSTDVLQASLQEVVDGIEELRTRLTGLEDAEEEVFHVAEEKQAVGQDDQDDKPDDKPDDKAKADKAEAEKAKADKAKLDDELERERRVRKAGGKPAGAATPGTDTRDDKAKPSTVWDPDDRSAVAEPAPKKSTAWDPNDRGGGGR